MTFESKAKALKIYQVLDDKKAIDVKILYVGELTTVTDYFVIATGNSAIHVKALCDEIEKKLYEEGIYINHIEGYNSAGWILIDCDDVVVHLFKKEERAFYNLERLWGDAKEVVLDNQI